MYYLCRRCLPSLSLFWRCWLASSQPLPSPLPRLPPLLTSYSSTSYGLSALGPPIPDPPSTRSTLRAIVLAWLVFACAVSWLMVRLWWLKWYALACSVCFVLLTAWGGGDELVLRVEESRAQQRQRTSHAS